MIALRPTPFHVRTAERNLANRWVERGMFSVPAHYGNAEQEALAARFSAVLIDMSAWEDVRVQGEGAAALLTAACRQDVSSFPARRWKRVFWCTNQGGLRGIGAVSRLASNDFLLRSVDADPAWFAPAAIRFGATLRDVTLERGLLMLAGPYASAVLAASGLEDATHLPPGEYAFYDWREVVVGISRRGFFEAFQISCRSEDGAVVFDRLMRAGRLFGLTLAGQEALELLHLEAGSVLPHLDFEPARDADARDPLPEAYGLSYSGAHEQASVLTGIELEAVEPAPFCSLFRNGRPAGRTLRSAYSPALRSAIALATMPLDMHEPGASIVVQRDDTRAGETWGRIVAFPFV